MKSLWRHRPAPAMIVAFVALMVALGGTSYAMVVLPAGSVGTTQLKSNAVIGSKVKNGSLTVADLNSASLSQLSRIGLASSFANVLAGNTDTLATVSLNVPRTGFVLVTGYVDEIGATGVFGVTVWDDTTSTSSQWFNGTTGTGGTEYTASQTGVFPVTAGVRTFSVRITTNGSSTDFNAWSTITAQFIPFGATGSRTVLGTAHSAVSGPAQHR
jgi:hypothetical protein